MAGQARATADLTVGERRALHALVAITSDGWPASVRELGAALGHASTSTTHHVLERLEGKGYATTHPRRQKGGWLPTVREPL